MVWLLEEAPGVSHLWVQFRRHSAWVKQSEAAEMSVQERAELKLIEESCELKESKWIMKYLWKRDPSCLPNNYVQVLKKLESIERRLMKQPYNANSYNAQIKEMEEMKFSRKVTEQEKKEWTGPVHYIAHHAVVRSEKQRTPIRIVFNSSASFKGHTLNDYWYKGPDLLNNLFGLVLRFRETKKTKGWKQQDAEGWLAWTKEA